NDPLVHARFGVPDGHYIGATRGNVVVDWLRRGATVRDLVEARGEAIIFDPSKLGWRFQEDYRIQMKPGQTVEQIINSKIPYDPSAVVDWNDKYLGEISADIPWTAFKSLAKQFPYPGEKGFIERSIWSLQRAALVNQQIQRIMQNAIDDIKKQHPTWDQKSPAFVAIMYQRLFPDWYVTQAGTKEYPAHDSFITDIIAARVSLTRETYQFLTRVNPVVDHGKIVNQLYIQDGNMIQAEGNLRLLERSAAAWGIDGLLKMIEQNGGFDALASHLTAITGEKVAAHQIKEAVRGLGAVERLVIADSINLLEDAQFSSGASTSRKDGLLDAVIDALSGRPAKLRDFLRLNRAGASVPVERLESLLNHLAAAEVNRITGRIKEVPKSQRTRPGVHESTIYAPTAAQSLWYYKRVQGMHQQPFARMYNPDYVGRWQNTKGVPVYRPLDGIYARFDAGTRTWDNIDLQAKDYHVDLLERTQDGALSKRMRDSLWDDMRATAFTMGGVKEAWIGMASEERGARNDLLVQRIDEIMKKLPRNDPRFGAFTPRAGEFLSYDTTMCFPFKLDAYKQELLEKYIAQYMAAHAGQLGSITVPQMLDDICRAHPELGIRPGQGTAFLVQNRYGNGNVIHEGIDPLDIEGGGKTPWRYSPPQIGIINPSSTMTLLQFQQVLETNPLNRFEGFFIIQQDVIVRVVLTQETRGHIVRQCMLLLDVLCDLAGIPNVLRTSNGWWTQYL
ncbi:MAG: hypothetical protein Q6370_007530, partial [Candidatus Sigynarchaeota archaeon]